MSDYITQLQSNPATPADVQALLPDIVTLYDRKLWFQLTKALEAVFNLPSSLPLRRDLFTEFVFPFHARINPLSLVAFAVRAAQQAEDPVAFLAPTVAYTEGLPSKEPYVFVRMEGAHFQLLQQDLPAVKATIDTCTALLDPLDSVDLVVHAAFYRVSGSYYKAKAQFAEYYRTSLLYLACIDIDTDLTAEQRTALARDLALSALLGKIYNFGEVLLHPILDSLAGTPVDDALRQLLFVFNTGDLAAFHRLVPTAAAALAPLAENAAFIDEKIRLMALIELVFQRPIADRVLSFELIAQATDLPPDRVEHLLMRALSLKLVRGAIDQIAGSFAVAWVQPRVLGKTQIAALQNRLEQWSDQVLGVAETAKLHAPELFVQ